MHPDIAAFPNEFFYQQEQLQPVPCPHQLETELNYPEPSEDVLDDQLKQHRVLFLPADDEASLVADVHRNLSSPDSLDTKRNSEVGIAPTG